MPVGLGPRVHGETRCRSARVRWTSPGFFKALKQVGYEGPLLVEREVGDQIARVRDIAGGLAYARECLASL